jgi:hypothetical protein
MKNPEVMLLRHLNRQFALDPCRPVVAGYLRTRRTISTWAPGLLPTGIRLNASGSYLAFNSFLVSSTDGSLSTVVIPLLPLRCRRGPVNVLQPRTHQPTGKTLETVKERVCFYSNRFRSQRKSRRIIILVFNEMRALHRRMTENGAVRKMRLSKVAFSPVIKRLRSS